MSEVPAASGTPTAAPSKVTEPQSAPVLLELPFILVTLPPRGRLPAKDMSRPKWGSVG